MQVPEQIIKFADEVRTQASHLSELVAKYNDLSDKRQKISEISQEYLRVQPFSPEDARHLLLKGIDVELGRVKEEAQDVSSKLYATSCGYPDSLIEENQQ